MTSQTFCLKYTRPESSHAPQEEVSMELYLLVFCQSEPSPVSKKIITFFLNNKFKYFVALLWFKEHKNYEQGLFVSKCWSKQNSNLFS